MNALMPIPLRKFSLGDKFRQTDDAVFLNGSQAILRLLLMRSEIDRENGLNTAGFVSGYRGSPVGGLDLLLWRNPELLADANVVFRPGVNEDLAATAIWGTQQVASHANAQVQGVFSLWYGKGPGVDRSGDVFKHANNYGTSRYGGVLALVGDDHAAKSSTLPNQSDHAMLDAEIPILYPASVAELLEFGLLGLDMSRFSGLWVAIKAVADVMDSTASVRIDRARHLVPRFPDITVPPEGLHGRFEYRAFDQERRLRNYRLPAAQAFARANGIDRITIDGRRARLGIIAAGRAYELVSQTLQLLGIGAERGGETEIRLYKVGMVWPLEEEGARHFVRGLERVLVVEERRAIMEEQLYKLAYHLPESERPRIFGKRDLDGAPLVSELTELSVRDILRVLLSVADGMEIASVVRQRLAALTESEGKLANNPLSHTRDPYFCSGCPHNRSTKVPEGAEAMGGIGCHFLVRNMNRSTDTFTHMGGEGVSWVGLSPFTEDGHIFANLGDGTYFHSGSLALRQAVTSGINITYKLLFNDAVAMTGGQPVEGGLTVPNVVRQLRSEGVDRIAVVSEDPERHRDQLGGDVSLHERAELDAVQQQFRTIKGVSVILYDQVCATEKRRRRKRATMARPDRRLFIHPEVCEGCGDCSRISNCIAIEPLETELGRKRRIDQSSCNQDFTCAEGFCPSFVSVIGARIRSTPRLDVTAIDGLPLPPPPVRPLDDEGWGMFVSGIGGQGVLALAAILGTAAHMERREVLIIDQHGMAQKGGGVYSHIRIAPEGTAIRGPRIAPGKADLILAADMVGGHGDDALILADTARTNAVVNTDMAVTAEFIRDNAVVYHDGAMIERIRQHCLNTDLVDGQRIVTKILGDAIYLNLFLLGYATQRGYVPISPGALEQAIALNGVAVEDNLHAFRLGRKMVVEPEFIRDTIQAHHQDDETEIAKDFPEIVAFREAALIRYQNRSYAQEYRSFVEWFHAKAHEKLSASRVTALTDAVARNLYRLMAYKDEYEVARLFAAPSFRQSLEKQFERGFRLRFHLAPPILGGKDVNTGRPSKRSFGPWLMPLFRVLAALRFLRGSWLDVFGWTAERREERRLIASYRADMEKLIGLLVPANSALATELGELPETIRGYGPIKHDNVRSFYDRRAAIWTELQAGESEILQAAE